MSAVETAEGGDMFIAAKPAWMDEHTWAEIKAKAVDKLDELVEHAQNDAVRRAVEASPEKGCSERTWCIMGPKNSDHLHYHAGDAVDLAHATHQDDGPSTGWWASLTEDRGQQEPRVMIEGVLPMKDGRHEVYSSELDVVRVWDVLHATSTPEARARLLELVTRAMGES